MTLERLNKTFGSTHIIKDVDLKVGDGEFVALPLGLRQVDPVAPDRRARVDQRRRAQDRDDVVNDLPLRERGVGMVFQSYALYPHTRSTNIPASSWPRWPTRSSMSA